MGNILDAYKAMVETSNDDNNLPDNFSGSENFDQEAYKTALEEMRRKIDEYDKHGTINGEVVKIKDLGDGMPDMADKTESVPEIDDETTILTMFKNDYKDTPEDELKTIKEECVPVVVRAFCPKCGKEIISTAPVMFNPYTLQKICKYDCECGWKANLEFAYPRILFRNQNGEEFDCYSK